MFSKLTAAAIFLALYISQAATSALPREPTAQPGEARNINGNIHARVPPAPPPPAFKPYNPHGCEYPYTWLRRRCTGPTTWHDVCFRSFNMQPELEYEPGDCEPDSTCFDIIDANGDQFVECRPNNKAGGKRKIDAQTGTSEPKRALTQLANTQMKHSVTVDHDMDKASVTAFVKSEDGSFWIETNNILVGNLHGKQLRVCEGDQSVEDKARECYPNGTYDFKEGDVIDYTWGMTSEQIGILQYAIIPAY